MCAGGLPFADMEEVLTDVQYGQLRAFLGDERARLDSLYHIVDKDGNAVRFRMNWAQRCLHETAHTRNNILKVRQLGISTYMAMLILDRCLFVPNFKAGIVDKTLKDAEAKLEKIRFAFEHLDDLSDGASPRERQLAEVGRMLKGYFAGARFTRDEAVFPNGSRVTIGTSLRGGTLQLLHVSELGSVAVHDPVRANEIVTGALNTVGKNCHIYLESTHEGGKYGVNYEQLLNAMGNIGKELGPLHFKFFFFPWYSHPEYADESYTPHPSVEQERYFAGIEEQCGVTLTVAQKAWYLAMARTQRSRMKQEYPSTPEEAMNPIADGTIYSMQIGDLRQRGHLAAFFEPDAHRPIYTAWDLGVGDYMSVWWVQPDGQGHWLVLDNYTANHEPMSHYVAQVRERDARWSRCAGCVVPHDGAKRDMNLDAYDSALSKAGYNVIRVPRTQNLWASVDNTREFLRTAIIHARCSEPTVCNGVSYISGVDALGNYRTAPPGANGTLRVQPLHDETSHAADALRTFADAVKAGLVSPQLGWAVRRGQRRRSSYVEDMLS